MSQVGKIVDSLDFNKMLATPFIAAAVAQSLLSQSTLDYLNSFALDESGNVITTTLSCIVDDPSGSIINTDASGSNQSIKSLTVPLLALLNVPALQMQKVVVKLYIEVNTMSTTDSSSNTARAASAGMKAKGNYGVMSGSANVNMSTSGASSKSKSDSTSTKVIYDVVMEAENKPPRGLDMILDWLTEVKAQPDRSKAVTSGQVPTI